MTLTKVLHKLNIGNLGFDNEVFTSDIVIHNTSIRGGYGISFTNCTFKGDIRVEGVKNLEFLTFSNCRCEQQIEIIRCSFLKISIVNTNDFTHLRISNTSCDSLDIENENQVAGEIYLEEVLIEDNLYMSNLDVESTVIVHLANKESRNLIVNFSNSSFQNFQLSGTCGKKATFNNLQIKKSCFFNEVDFQKALFKEADFGSETHFINCKFNSKTEIIICNSYNSKLYFYRCLFKSFIHFNDSKFNHLDIKYTTFERKTSFDRLETNTLNFYQTTFLQSTYFDELKIIKIKDRNYIKSLNLDEARNLRLSIRLIKHEIQKSENRIDYNRFRSYELQAYYQELKADGRKFFDRDRFILWTTRWATGFDHSWKQALFFTIISGLAWYSPLYFTQYTGAFDIIEINNYFSGAFKFFLITDFSSPFKEKGEYFDLAINWLPLILGKIFIAFGIYEMIQAFRKFKA